MYVKKDGTTFSILQQQVLQEHDRDGPRPQEGHLDRSLRSTEGTGNGCPQPEERGRGPKAAELAPVEPKALPAPAETAVVPEAEAKPAKEAKPKKEKKPKEAKAKAKAPKA